MANIAPLGKYILIDSNGDPLSGGKVYTYEAGTTTPKATFTTQDESVANANPVVLDSDGRADIWLGDGGYKFVVTDSNDVELFTTDDLGGTSSVAFGANVNTISANTGITEVYANSFNVCTSSPTLSLLSASSAGEGFYFIVINNGAGVVTIDPDASETINGAATLVLNPEEGAIVICDGTNWQAFNTNGFIRPGDDTTFTGDNIFQGVIDVTNINAETSAGGALRTNGGTNCLSWGSGGAANLTAGGNLSMGTTHKIVNCADPTSAQDVATKAYVDSEVGASPFSSEYYSAETAISVSGTTDFTHGLGVVPKTGCIELICKTAEYGFSVDDIKEVPFGYISFSAADGIGVRKTDTLIRLDIQNAIHIDRIDTYSTVALTPANWRIRVRAWA